MGAPRWQLSYLMPLRHISHIRDAFARATHAIGPPHEVAHHATGFNTLPTYTVSLFHTNENSLKTHFPFTVASNKTVPTAFTLTIISGWRHLPSGPNDIDDNLISPSRHMIIAITTVIIAAISTFYALNIRPSFISCRRTTSANCIFFTSKWTRQNTTCYPHQKMPLPQGLRTVFHCFIYNGWAIIDEAFFHKNTLPNTSPR
jgi:hypothetical protein